MWMQFCRENWTRRCSRPVDPASGSYFGRYTVTQSVLTDWVKGSIDWLVELEETAGSQITKFSLFVSVLMTVKPEATLLGHSAPLFLYNFYPFSYSYPAPSYTPVPMYNSQQQLEQVSSQPGPLCLNLSQANLSKGYPKIDWPTFGTAVLLALDPDLESHRQNIIQQIGRHLIGKLIEEL